jgi:RecA-family ATPase
MAAFCNQFDKVCTELGCAVIYCHHHSKGAQGGKKSMDRASGSGVFARDPDALLDMIQLPLDDDQQKTIADKAECMARVEYLRAHHVELPGPDDQLSAVQMKAWCDSHLAKPGGWAVPGKGSIAECNVLADKARKEAMSRTAWRIEGTLREFPAFPPVNLWFQYPIHRIDGEGGILQDIDPEEVKPLWQKASESRKKKNKKKGDKVLNDRIMAHANLVFDNDGNDGIKLTDISEAWNIGERAARTYIKNNSQHFYINDGLVYAANPQSEGKK